MFRYCTADCARHWHSHTIHHSPIQYNLLIADSNTQHNTKTISPAVKWNLCLLYIAKRCGKLLLSISLQQTHSQSLRVVLCSVCYRVQCLVTYTQIAFSRCKRRYTSVLPLCLHSRSYRRVRPVLRKAESSAKHYVKINHPHNISYALYIAHVPPQVSALSQRVRCVLGVFVQQCLCIHPCA